MQTHMTKIIVDKNVKTHQQQNKMSIIKFLGRDRNQTQDLLYALPILPMQLNVLIKVKLLNCFSVKGQNIKKQIQICYPHVFCTF